MISMDKKYVTRDGRPVRLICIDETLERYPVIGVIGNEDEPSSWTKKGYYLHYETETGPNDLVEVKEEKTVDFGWLNIYPNNVFGGVAHATKEQADKRADPHRIACVHLLVKYKEGDGLTPNEKP